MDSPKIFTTIHGYLSNSDGAPIPCAAIEIAARDTGAAAEGLPVVVRGEDGAFRCDGLGPAILFTVSVHHPEYVATRSRITARDCPVELSSSDDLDAETITTTDGSFILRGIPSGAFSLRAAHPEHGASKPQNFERGVELITLELHDHAAVPGFVVDDRGLPMVGAEITIEDPSAFFPTATTNLGGFFRLAAVRIAHPRAVPPAET